MNKQTLRVILVQTCVEGNTLQTCVQIINKRDSLPIIKSFHHFIASQKKLRQWSHLSVHTKFLDHHATYEVKTEEAICRYSSK